MAKKKILIADDEEHIRQLVSRMLESDFTVVVAENGKEAVEIARQQQPDLILMDIMMPNVDGFSACYTIKRDKATSAIPVVMLTGVGFELNKKLSREIGAEGYITKPFNPDDLRAVIDRLLKESL